MTNLSDVQTERAAIRCALVEPELFRNHLDAGDFFDDRNRAIWLAGKDIITSGRPVNIETLNDALIAAGILDSFNLLAELYEHFESPVYIDAYAETLRKNALKRDMLALYAQAQRPAAGEDPPDADFELDALIRQLGVLRAKNQQDSAAELEPALVKSYDLSECPVLPETAQLDPALGLDAAPWLDSYIAFSRMWAPRAYDDFHESTGLSVLSTVAARRVKLDFGGERFTSLMIANIARSSVFTKSTAHHIGGAFIEAAGLAFLLAPDDATPQALLSRMSLSAKVKDWNLLTPEQREREALRLAFAGQKGWDFDEFGAKVSSMMRDSGVMADFRGLLRRFDDCPKSYSYATIGRGENAIERPYLTILASLTPADMAPYAKPSGALWRDGFWARFAFVAPSPDAQPSFGRFPSGARILPYDLISKLRRWHDSLGVPDVDVVQRIDAEGKPTDEFNVTVTARPPQDCQLGTGVFERFYAYHDALTALAAASDNADLDGNYSRFAEKALRVAMLIASFENAGRIELCHWARAQTIAERWRESLHNLYRTMNSNQDEAGRVEDQIAETVKRLGAKGATPTVVRRYVRNVSTTEAATILDRLTKAGVLRSEKTRKGTMRYEYCES